MDDDSANRITSVRRAKRTQTHLKPKNQLKTLKNLAHKVLSELRRKNAFQIAVFRSYLIESKHQIARTHTRTSSSLFAALLHFILIPRNVEPLDSNRFDTISMQ